MIRLVIILITFVIFSCQPVDQEHSHNESGGHAYDTEMNLTEKITFWTDKTELYVEFPALVTGKISRFASHFTILNGHEPVKDGSVTVSLIKEGKGIRSKVDAPSSPGIFSPSLKPKEAGVYQLVFDLKTAVFSDRIVINSVKVYNTIDEAQKGIAGREMKEGDISFLKEQAWKTDFQTQKVVEDEIYEVIKTSGVWKSSPSDYKTLVAKTSGTVDFKLTNLTEGSWIKKGQEVMTVTSKELTTDNLKAEIEKAKANYEYAKSEYERKQELVKEKIVSKADFDKAKNVFLIAKSDYETLKDGHIEGGKHVIIPFGGYIKSVHINNGEYVEQGTALITISTHQSSLLEIQVNPKYNTQVRSLQEIWFQPSEGMWSHMSKNGGYVQSIGKEVTKSKPFLSVFVNINEPIDMPVGSFTEVQMALGISKSSVVVPRSALIEDYGRYAVIVQVSGESFERREVILGKSNGNNVEIMSGLSQGEVIVTKGAYQVKMASMSGQVPAHGHSH